MSTTTCPRCDAPVKGDFQYCPECAYRLRATAPESDESAPSGGRSGGLLLALGAVAMLAAGYFVGVKILRPDPPPAYVPPPEAKALTVADIQDHLVLIPSGTASYVREVVYYVPPFDEAVQALWDSFAAKEPPITDDDPEVEDRPPSFEELLERPRALARWLHIVKDFIQRTRPTAEEKEAHLPIVTRPFLMMTHEVSRGQYAEFLRSVQARPAVLTQEDFVRDLLWRPAPTESERQVYSKHYRDQWWQRVAEHHHTRHGRELERPDWLDQTGLSDKQGAMLLVPPAWVHADPYGSLSWALEPGTEGLPVTEISWWDAHMFVVWARQALGISTLSLPNQLQWMRAFHGGHPNRPPDDFDEEGDAGWRWPWGNSYDPAGCNCGNFPPNQEGTPTLRHVRRRYNWHEGKTVDGVLNMAGNAAEWVDNAREVLPSAEVEVDGPYRILTWEWLDKEATLRIPNAYTAGGSYLAGIGDCGLPLNATLGKCAREAHVGFRLIMSRGPVPGY